MWRIILEAVLIFAIPFMLYAGWQAFAERDPKAALKMSKGPAAWLSLAGMILVIGSIAAWELSADPKTGGYQRATWKNGVLIPAEVK